MYKARPELSSFDDLIFLSSSLVHPLSWTDPYSTTVGRLDKSVYAFNGCVSQRDGCGVVGCCTVIRRNTGNEVVTVEECFVNIKTLSTVLEKRHR